jgi:hypothetical protein
MQAVEMNIVSCSTYFWVTLSVIFHLVSLSRIQSFGFDALSLLYFIVDAMAGYAGLAQLLFFVERLSRPPRASFPCRHGAYHITIRKSRAVPWSAVR